MTQGCKRQVPAREALKPAERGQGTVTDSRLALEATEKPWVSCPFSWLVTGSLGQFHIMGHYLGVGGQEPPPHGWHSPLPDLSTEDPSEGCLRGQ